MLFAGVLLGADAASCGSAAFSEPDGYCFVAGEELGLGERNCGAVRWFKSDGPEPGSAFACDALTPALTRSRT